MKFATSAGIPGAGAGLGVSPASEAAAEIPPVDAAVLLALRDETRLAQLAAAALLDTPAEEAFDRLTRLTTRLLGVPIALLSLVTAERQFFKSAIGLAEPWASQRETPLSHSFCQYVVASREPLIVGDAHTHPQLHRNLAIRDLGVVAYLGIPLMSPEGQPLGSFCAIDSQPRTWTADEISTLRDLVAAAVTEITLRATMRALECERVALREEVAHNRLIMDSISQGLTISDGSDRFTYVNPAYARLMGREPADLIGLTPFDTTDPINRATVTAMRARVRAAGPHAPVTYEMQLRHADGELLDAQIASVALGQQGEILTAISDLTEAKAIEVELRRERDFTAAILETAGSLVVVLDRAGKILRFNRACELLTGRSFARVAGRSLDAALSAPEAAPFVATWELLRAGVPPVSFEHSWRNTLGERRLIDWTVTALLDERGHPAYVVAVGLDITERKQAERQRTAEHAVSSALAEATSLAAAAPVFLEAICTHLDLAVGELWLPDASGDHLQCNARWSLLHDRDEELALLTQTLSLPRGVGLPGRVWASGEPIWWHLPTEPNVPRARAIAAAGLQGGVACPITIGQVTRGGLVFLSEEPQPPNDGLRATLDAIGRQFGQFLEHRWAEAALHTAHQRLDFHVQNAPLGVVEWGADMRILRWSAEAERIFGWSAEEVVGRLAGSWRLTHEDDVARGGTVIDALLSGQSDRNVHRNRNYTKAGDIVHTEWHNSVLRDAAGGLVSVLSLALDITERVRLQERLAHQASHDALTALPNRALLLDRLNQQLLFAERAGQMVAVLFLDLDGFKAVNDRLGHAAGDELLIAIASRLQGHVRAGDTVARLGGDEFVLVLSALTNRREVTIVVERLIAAIGSPILLAMGEVQVSASIGIAFSSPDCSDPEALLAAADGAMYAAKQAGKGRYFLAEAVPVAGRSRPPPVRPRRRR